MSLKLSHTLIDSCVVFFHLPGPSETSFNEITFGGRPVRQEMEELSFSRSPAKNNFVKRRVRWPRASDPFLESTENVSGP